MFDYSAVDTARPIYTPDPVNRRHPLNSGRVAWYIAIPQTSGGQWFYDLMGLGKVSLGTANSWGNTFRTGGFGQVVPGTSLNSFWFPTLSATAPPFTFGAWWKPLSSWSSGKELVTIQVSGSVQPKGYCLYYRNNFGDFMGIDSNNAGVSTQILESSFSPSTNWHHTLITVDAGYTCTLYMDGRSFGSATIATVSGFDTIGPNGFDHTNSEPSFNPADIATDDLGLWNRVLSAAEAKAYYDISRLGYPGVLNRIGGSISRLSAMFFRRALNARTGARSPHSTGFGGL